MAQTPNVAKEKGTGQKHLPSRISYLYQAATYLAKIAERSQAKTVCSNKLCVPREELRCPIATPEAVPNEGLPVSPIDQEDGIPKIDPNNDKGSKDFALSRQMGDHLRAVSLKNTIRLSPAVKQSMCKRCNLLLIPGFTSTSSVENKSRRGRKPWADVLVTTCFGCGTSKRFPVGAKRQLRKETRICKVQKLGS